MNPPGKGGGGPETEVTDEVGKPLDPTVNVTPDPALHNDPARVQHHPAPPVHMPAAPPRVPGGPEPTISVSPEPGVHNDPNRILWAREEAASEPTSSERPEPGMHNDPARVQHRPPSLPGKTIPAGPPVFANLPEPTLNVSPEPGVHNDPNRILWARDEAAAAPTVNVIPDPGVHNDPARVQHHTAIPVKTVPAAPPFVPDRAEPTVNVSPEPGVHNDPNRILWARQELAAAPTVNVTPDLALQNVPHRVGLGAMDEAPTRTEASARTDPGVQWGRPEDAPAPTLNVVPDRGLINDPQRTAYVMPDPDSTHRVFEKPHALIDAMSTVRTDPASDSAPTVSVTPDRAVVTDPDPTQNEPAELPTSVISRPGIPAEARVTIPARMSPPKPPLLDGVAPLVPIQQFPSAAPSAVAVTMRNEPPVVIDDPALANYRPEPAPATQKSQVPVAAWRESEEVKNWAPDERDATKIMPAAARPKEGLRPPSTRDVLVLLVGCVLLVAGMIIVRRETHEGVGPLPAEKIKPPPGYEAPKQAKTTAPYVAPDSNTSAAGTYSMVGSGSAGTASSSSGASGGAPAAAASPSVPPPRTAAPPPSIRMPVPRCQLNVPQALETKVSWELDGKRKLLRLRVTPKRLAVQTANLFVANAQLPEGAELVRTENAAVWFDVFLDPPANGPNVLKVVLDCECGIAAAEVQAVINLKELEATLKYIKIAPPEVIAAHARKVR